MSAAHDIPKQPPRQDSLSLQMADVLIAAMRLGCYDAMDWIRAGWVVAQSQPVVLGIAAPSGMTDMTLADEVMLGMHDKPHP